MNPFTDDTNDSGQMVPLAEPRPLAAAERALLDALVAPLDIPALAEQIGRAEVVAHCSCGCPSIGLQTDAPELAPEIVGKLSDTGRDDLLDVSAWAANEAGGEVEVTLHVLLGRVKELEVWAGTLGGDTRVQIPAVASLYVGREERRD